MAKTGGGGCRMARVGVKTQLIPSLEVDPTQCYYFKHFARLCLIS